MVDTMGHTQVHVQFRRWLTVEDGLNDQASIYGNGTSLWTNFASPRATDPLLQGLIPHLDKEWRFQDVDLSGSVVKCQVSLRGELRALVADKAQVIEGWIAEGRMAPVDPVHLFISLWALTQTYADFETQVCAVLGRPQLSPEDYGRATAHVQALVLRGCGL